jgi:hypothetical protein
MSFPRRVVERIRVVPESDAELAWLVRLAGHLRQTAAG